MFRRICQAGFFAYALFISCAALATSHIYFINENVAYTGVCDGRYVVQQQIYINGQLFCFDTIATTDYTAAEINGMFSSLASTYVTQSSFNGFIAQLASLDQLNGVNSSVIALTARVAALEASPSTGQDMFTGLSLQNGIDIALAIGAVWAAAWCFRAIRLALKDRSDSV